VDQGWVVEKKEATEKKWVPQRRLEVWSYTEKTPCNSIPPSFSVEPLLAYGLPQPGY
jgi:hypothetical protein